jgi:hypothetical protein
MKSRLGFVALLAIVVASSFGFVGRFASTPDLSTPQKSFTAFVDILKSGNISQLSKVATETGQVSLVSLYQNQGDSDGLTILGKELGASKPRWEEITEDIYFASAHIGDKVHKMEFTKEEPGWMLYHWQIGGGADAHGIDQVSEPQD